MILIEMVSFFLRALFVLHQATKKGEDSIVPSPPKRGFFIFTAQKVPDASIKKLYG